MSHDHALSCLYFLFTFNLSVSWVRSVKALLEAVENGKFLTPGSNTVCCGPLGGLVANTSPGVSSTVRPTGTVVQGYPVLHSSLSSNCSDIVPSDHSATSARYSAQVVRGPSVPTVPLDSAVPSLDGLLSQLTALSPRGTTSPRVDLSPRSAAGRLREEVLSSRRHK